MNKTLSELEGWKNRHLDPLPDEPCVIIILHNDITGTSEIKCQWTPFDESNYVGKPEAVIPAPEYLGTANRIKNNTTDIGFHAWDCNDSEFVYYRIEE